MKHLLASAINLLKNINRIIETILKPIAMLLVVLMLGAVIWGVVARLTGISAPWTDKVMLIMLPALAFIVAPIAYRRSANVTLDLLRDALSPRARHLHGLVLHLGILLLLLIGLDLTLRKVGIDPGLLSTTIHMLTGLDLTEIRPFAAPMRIPVIGILWRDVYMVMPVCIVLMIFANIELLLRHILAWFDASDALARPVRTLEDSESKLWD